MPEATAPFYVDSPMTLRQIIRAAYLGPFRDRFTNAERGAKQKARVETVLQWKVHYAKGVPIRDKVHSYRIKVVAIKPDGSVSNYPVFILLDSLSVDARCKIRCGGLFQYTGKDTLQEKRICPDFYFRFMNVLKRIGILYHRDSTNRRPPVKTNSTNAIGLCKHLWSSLISIVESNFLGEAGEANARANAKIIEDLR